MKIKNNSLNASNNISSNSPNSADIRDINEQSMYRNIKKKRRRELLFILIKELILFIIIVLSIIKYIQSLKTTEIEEKDFDPEPSFFMNLIYDCFFSAFFTTIALALIEFKICKIYQLFLILFIYSIFFITNTGENLDGHGTYNTIFFLLCIALGQIVILIIYCIKLAYNKNRIVVISVLLIIFISSIIIYITKIEDKIKCKNWEYGLNNTKLNNELSEYPCSIIIPDRKCYLNFLGPFFDFSKTISCLNRKEEDKNKLKSVSKSPYVNKDTKRIGFPITTHRYNFNCNKQQNSQNLYNEIMKNLVDMDNKKQLEELGNKEKPEVVLDFTNNTFGEIHIDINYDKELSKQRKKLEENTTVLYDNIIFIFFDAISRNHFSRVFKKSSQFLEKFFKYEGASNEKDPSQKYHGFQFFKQHSFREFTLGNNIPMFYGKPYYYKKVESITGEFKQKGFITANLNGICNKEAFYFDWQLKENMERNFVEFDHEMFALSCDPNIFDEVNPHSIGLGESSVFRRCLYGRESVEYLFEYGTKFLEQYNNNRKYLRISIPNGHELSGQVSKYVDQPLLEFLNYTYSNNLLKNTALILSADHGLSILVLYKLFQSIDQEIEVNNPMLIFIVSDNKNKSYEEQYENIHKNQQTFITTYDIYHSLKHIINGKDIPITKDNIEKRGETFNPKEHFLGTSLFNYIDKNERFCSNYYDIKECICKLKNNKKK
jgi:hypothetical protein